VFGPRPPINNVVDDLGARANGRGGIVDIDFVECDDHHLVNHHNHHDHDRTRDHHRPGNNRRVIDDKGR
jgi:hypothetical protein